jgi:AcrR family transcriptional regulator
MSPRGNKQNDQMRAEALARISEAALRIFSDYGYNGATMRQIASAAGLSTGLVYHYFPSKEKVFVHLVDTGLQISLQAMRQLLSSPASAWERIKTYCEMVIATMFSGDASQYFLIMYQAMTQGKAITGLAEHIAAQVKGYYDLLVPVIIEAQESGDVISGDPWALTAAFLSYIQGLANLTYQPHGFEKKITAEFLYNMLKK